MECHVHMGFVMEGHIKLTTFASPWLVTYSLGLYKMLAAPLIKNGIAMEGHIYT